MVVKFEPTTERNDIGQIIFVRDNEWILDESSQLYDLINELEEDLPIFKTVYNPEQSLARSKLEPVFVQMN